MADRVRPSSARLRGSGEECADSRVVIVDKEPVYAQALEALIEKRTSFLPLVAESLAESLLMLGSGAPEAILWSGECLDDGALGQVRDARGAHQGTGFCMLAQSADPTALQRFLADGAGPFAVVLRNGSLELPEILTALQCVLAGRSMLDPQVLEEVLHGPAGADDPLSALTATEREILDLVAAGLNNRTIAARLFRSQKAVERHVGHIFLKLGLRQESSTDLDRRVSAARIFLLQPQRRARPRAQRQLF
ncbi:MAG TPA: response regulator transcription factor [Thermoleophilaceae bacterium]|jgi:DNA-binding NarL/FixJ family response regulator|nr:response regulator transcription factor [Thermoleophilaceae bacterium]